MILLIVVGAKIFGVVSTLTQVTQNRALRDASTHPPRGLSLIIAVYIVLGCFMDQVATMILTVPITAPGGTALGFDPVWFGVIVVVTAEIGMVTPPVGLNAFIVSRTSSVPLAQVFSGLWPHIIAHLIVIVILCAFPQLVLWLPKHGGSPITTRTKPKKEENPMKLGIAVTFAGCLAMAGGAAAQDYTFRLADALPPEHIITRAAGQPFMDKVEELTNGKVTFQHFPAGQLGKGEGILDAVKSGLADVGYIIPSHIQGKMALSAVAELPGGYPTACAGTKALMKLAMPGGLLDKLDFEPNGVRSLVTVVLPPYQADFASADIKSLDDIKGLKIRSNPGPMEMSIDALGGVPIRMTPPEIYESKGTIDGFYLPYVSVISYGLDEQVKSVTKGANFGSVVITYGMAIDKWKTLPPEIQEAMTEAGRQVSLSACKQFDDEEAAAGDKLKEKGVQFVNFSAIEGDDLKSRFDKLGEEWAKLMEERGEKEASHVPSRRSAKPWLRASGATQPN